MNTPRLRRYFRPTRCSVGFGSSHYHYHCIFLCLPGWVCGVFIPVENGKKENKGKKFLKRFDVTWKKVYDPKPAVVPHAFDFDRTPPLTYAHFYPFLLYSLSFDAPPFFLYIISRIRMCFYFHHCTLRVGFSPTRGPFLDGAQIHVASAVVTWNYRIYSGSSMTRSDLLESMCTYSVRCNVGPLLSRGISQYQAALFSFPHTPRLSSTPPPTASQ